MKKMTMTEFLSHNIMGELLSNPIINRIALVKNQIIIFIEAKTSIDDLRGLNARIRLVIGYNTDIDFVLFESALVIKF